MKNAHDELRAAREHGDGHQASAHALESSLRDKESAVNRLRLQIVDVESERDTLSNSLKEAKNALARADEANAAQRDELERARRDLARAVNTESELRNAIDARERSGAEVTSLRDNLARVQTELVAANSARQALGMFLQKLLTLLYKSTCRH